ncbi:50S ribosomal protein L2 [Patescibacteria group bacterium]
MKRLKRILPKKSGRSKGTVTVRHQGGRQKRFLRKIDFKRSKLGITAKVEAIEYDPNRNADIALLLYKDGERRYIIAPAKLKVGDKVLSDTKAPLKPGNSMQVGNILIGTQIHNIELMPGKGGQLVKGAGSVATIHGKEEDYVLIKLPSGEIRRVRPECMATIGQVGNAEHRTRRIDKAGTKRLMGIRPTVRGVAQNPSSHPHGGGEGRSGVGMKYPKTPQGRRAVGKTRKKRKYSDKLIIKKRKPGKHSHN